MSDSREEIPASTGTSGDEAIPRSFFILGAVALVWNLLGLVAYVMQVTLSDEARLALPEAERLLYESVPVWATSAFAIAVNGGVLGCALLLFRSAWALPVLLASLLGVVVQNYHSFVVAGVVDVYGPGAVVMPSLVLAVSIWLVWYAWRSRNRGWIS